MHYAAGDRKTLPGVEGDGAVLQVDQQLAIEHKKELIILIVFMPVVFAFDDTDAYDAVVYFCQRLIEPFVANTVHYVRNIDEFLMGIPDVQKGGIRELIFHF